MSRGRKLGLLAFVAATALSLYWFFYARGPNYQGRSVAEWFEIYDRIQNQSFYERGLMIPPGQSRPADPDEFARADMAFVKLGTNSIPFLVGRMLADPDYSRIESWRIKLNPKLPGFLKWLAPVPKFRGIEGATAANLLATRVDAPAGMLLPLLHPMLRGTNSTRRILALSALQAIDADHKLARPYLEEGLKGSDPNIQRIAISIIRYNVERRGETGTWAINELSNLAASPRSDVHTSAVLALRGFGSHARLALPKLEEMLAQETAPSRLSSLSNAIHILSELRP